MNKIETKFNAYVEKDGMDDDYLAEVRRYASAGAEDMGLPTAR